MSYSGVVAVISDPRTAEGITEDDDPQLGYLTSSKSISPGIAPSSNFVSAWCYVADALGEGFEPWVKPVMEKMIQGASQAVQVKAYNGP